MNIDAANKQFLANVLAGTANWYDIRPAYEVIPVLSDYTVLHAGPPLTWEQMCGPMRGAITGACIYEGWANSADEVTRLATGGKLRFDSSHHHHAIGPMSGIITPTMMVNVVKNEIFGIETYSTLYMGIGKVLRHGAFDQEVIAKLHWMNQTLAPLLKMALQSAGGIDIKSIIAQSLQMGDELHNRNKASNALLLNSLVQHIIRVAEKDAAIQAIDFIDKAGHFILNTVMAAAKGMLDGGTNITGSTMVTAIARNGFETGIRVSGLGEQWFRAPAPLIDGVYFPGFGPEDANPDLGDSAIAETIGLGSFSMAGAPAVVEYIGGTAQFALETSLKMYEITSGEHQTFKLPPLNFRGTPLGIDIRKVVETGITPVINTGIACRRPGVGQIGAGLTAVPLACFTSALEAFARKHTA
jgi:hypothetical protein